MKWTRITAAENIPLRQGRQVTVGGRSLAIFNLGGEFRAVESHCPHKGGPLADGIVSGADVICPLHNWRVSLANGEVCRPADQAGCVATFPVKVVSGEVVVLLPAPEQEREKVA